MGNKTHWKTFTNPNYLGAYAFQPDEEKIVTIKEVKREAVQNQNGTEECTVCHFEEDVKPLILNKTNAGMIAKVWGTPYLEDWPGCKIKLKVKRIKAFGEMTDAVRVLPDRPAAEPDKCSVCGKIIPADIAKLAMKKFNKKICVECARKEHVNG